MTYDIIVTGLLFGIGVVWVFAECIELMVEVVARKYREK